MNTLLVMSHVLQTILSFDFLPNNTSRLKLVSEGETKIDQVVLKNSQRRLNHLSCNSTIHLCEYF